MRITEEEKLMYGVMKAIYDSGIPVDFKGAMVLKACLMEQGYPEDIRHTVDIDANWYSDTPPTAEQLVQSIQDALHKGGIDLEVKLYRMYSEGMSAGFEFAEPSTGEAMFSMDMDVNRPAPPTKIYQTADFRFRGVAVEQMLADKVMAVSSDKVFRRIKDVVDLYYLSKAFVFDSAGVRQILSDSGRTLESFSGFLHRSGDLRHAYEKFRFAGDVEKPPFEEVYRAVRAYIGEMLPREKQKDSER